MNVKSLFLIFFLLCFVKGISAQTYNWSVLTGDTLIQNDLGTCIAKDNSGKIVACGWFAGTINLDPASSGANAINAPLASAFFARYNPNGILLWSKYISGSSYVSINDVVTDFANNIFVTGTHAGTTDFDPGVGVENRISYGNSSNMFVAKYDSNGNFLWAHSCGSNGNTDAGYTIALDNMNNVVVGGHFTGSANFDPNLTAAGSATASGSLDAFVAKYDVLGNFQWVKTWAPSKCWELSIDAVGNIYVFSEYNISFDANPGSGVYNLTCQGNEDVFIIKLNPSGNFIWAKSLGTTGYESAGAIQATGTSAFYITGQYSDTMDFDFGPNNSLLQPINNSNSYVAKYDTAGNLQWAKTFGDSAYCRLEGIDVANNGDVSIVGEYFTFNTFTLDANPGVGSFPLSSSCSQETGIIIRLNSNGQFKNAFDIEGTERMNLYDVVCDDNENVYVSGFYTDSVFIDPNNIGNLSAVGKGLNDIIIAKYTYSNPTRIHEFFKKEELKLYPNPASTKVYITNEKLDATQYNIYNQLGACVKKENITSKNSLTIEIDISHLPRGVYIAKLIKQNGKSVQQVFTLQ